MNQETILHMTLLLVAAVGAFLLTFGFMKLLLPRLYRYKLNQPISIYAPKTHIGKGSTPTLGGLSFVAGSTVLMIPISLTFILLGKGRELLPLVFTFGLALLNAAIGFFDDYQKLVKKHNVGLRAWQKLLLQLIVGAIYLVLMIAFGEVNTVLYIPYFNFTWDLGYFTYVIALLLITGMVNSTNLTDGVDGLLSSTSAVCACFFIGASLLLQDAVVSVLPALLLGSMIAFLLFNAHPAKVFMGDTGSLFIGSLLVGTAFLMGNPLIILVAGGIYVVETASVILQVVSCKLIRLGLRKTRFFKRTPIHHHFEDKGYTENQIVVSSTLVALLFSFLAYLGVV